MCVWGGGRRHLSVPGGNRLLAIQINLFWVKYLWFKTGPHRAASVGRGLRVNRAVSGRARPYLVGQEGQLAGVVGVVVVQHPGLPGARGRQDHVLDGHAVGPGGRRGGGRGRGGGGGRGRRPGGGREGGGVRRKRSLNTLYYID